MTNFLLGFFYLNVYKIFEFPKYPKTIYIKIHSSFPSSAVKKLHEFYFWWYPQWNIAFESLQEERRHEIWRLTALSRHEIARDLIYTADTELPVYSKYF